MSTFSSVTLSSWDEIHDYGKPNWLYRGQRSHSWGLMTSLERCLDREGIEPIERRRVETELLRDFQRLYHQYSTHIPEDSATLEWLSVMQHYGAPTRLLDFTYSIYVAAYFALECADSDSALWAIDGPWAVRQCMEVFSTNGRSNVDRLREPFLAEHERIACQIFFEGPALEFASPMNPFRLNERLRIQKGVFLVPGDIRVPFEVNLRALAGHDDPAHVMKLVLPSSLRSVALPLLDLMGITRTNLFPGIDGYAQSLGVYHPCYRPPPWFPP